MGQPRVDEWLILPFLSIALISALCLFEWFAWSNFPRYGLRVTRLIGQFAVILSFAVWLILMFFFSALIFLNGGSEAGWSGTFGSEMPSRCTAPR